MLELPEVINIARELEESVLKKTVDSVLPPTKKHRFCWFSGSPEDYGDMMKASSPKAASGFGMFVLLEFDNGKKLCFDDGVNVRLTEQSNIPKNYQLCICFTDGTALVFTVAMYGGICLFEGMYENDYYIKSENAVSPFSDEFEAYYMSMVDRCKKSLSAKAFVATNQHFPGIGNGTLQDILFKAKIHPKRKIGSFSENDKKNLMDSIVSVLKEMTRLGGRDTEKDLYGAEGGYRTLMSKNTLFLPCPCCGSNIKKEAYLGGSVYYCPSCQKI